MLVTADLLRAASAPYVGLFWTARAFASDDEQLGDAAASLHGTAVSVAGQLEERLARAESVADCLAAYGSQLQWMKARSASLVAACDEHHAALGRAEQELDQVGDDADLASLDLSVLTAAERLDDAMADFDVLADQFEREVETTIYRLRDIAVLSGVALVVAVAAAVGAAVLAGTRDLLEQKRHHAGDESPQAPLETKTPLP